MTQRHTLRRHLLSATAFAVAVSFAGGASADIWQDVSTNYRAKGGQSSAMAQQVSHVKAARRLSLNLAELSYVLKQAPSEQLGLSNTQIELPLPTGELRLFTLYHSPIMAASLAEQYPDIQTYKIVDSVHPENTGRLDLTPEGFHGVFSHNGETVFIDPIGNSGQYQSYFKSDYAAEKGGDNRTPFVCSTHNEETSTRLNKQTPAASDTKKKFSFGTNLRTYRLAVAATGEYSTFHGGTKDKSLAAIVTAINRINEIYERDAAVKFELVASNDKIIYTNGSTDPFTDDDTDALISEVVTEINDKIGFDNYDIGHVFSTGGGGLAGFGVVCGLDKAEGVTGTEAPVGDSFYIDYVAHEIGHQFKANHTFNGTADGCGGNRAPTAAYEPGSGTTIMGYASLCEGENVQASSDVYFHTHSLTQISDFLADTAKGGSCGVSTTLNNAAPVPNAGADGHIPKSTPFTLTGSATDANAGDSLTYTWEQYDLGASTSSEATHTDDGSRPLFRSFSPTTSVSRTFPQISDVLSGTPTYGEVLPTKTRDLNFRLTVRDGKGGVAADEKKLRVDSTAGPFVVTAPAAVFWKQGTSQTVTWDVANTNTAPISCAAVDILLSQDGGQTFQTTVVASTPNDGSESIIVPTMTTSMGRIQVKCTSQPFFAVNNGRIAIGSVVPVNTQPVANADSFTVEENSSAADLAVLSNDADADNDTLSIAAIDNISNGGTASINGTAISYKPARDFSGTETLSYTVTDGNETSAAATVTITVTAAPAAAPTTSTATTSTATTSTATMQSSGGGGSFGLFMLLILGAARRLKSLRLGRASAKAKG